MPTAKKRRAIKAAIGRDTRAKLSMVSTRKGKGLVKLTFGDVTISAQDVSTQQKKFNVVSGQVALARAKKQILKPGVKLQKKKSIPLFYINPKRPNEIIRLFRGKSQRGVLVNGAFKVIE